MTNSHGNTQNGIHAIPVKRFDPGQVPVKDDLAGLHDDVQNDAEVVSDAATRRAATDQTDIVELEDEGPVDPGTRQAGTEVEGVVGDDRDSDVVYPPPDDVL